MKDIFNKLMTVILGVTVGLFVALGLAVVILGSQQSEEALKTIFRLESNKEAYESVLALVKGKDK